MQFKNNFHENWLNKDILSLLSQYAVLNFRLHDIFPGKPHDGCTETYVCDQTSHFTDFIFYFLVTLNHAKCMYT